MSKKAETHWYINGDEGCFVTDKPEPDVSGYFRVDSSNTEKSTSLEGLDESDGWLADLLSNKCKFSEEQISNKIDKCNSLIEKQLKIKEDNVSKYLKDTRGNLDKNQIQKFKTNFEKINLKCSHNIEQLQNKKNAYIKKSRQIQLSRQNSFPSPVAGGKIGLSKRTSLTSNAKIMPSTIQEPVPPNLSIFFGSADDVINTNTHNKRNDISSLLTTNQLFLANHFLSQPTNLVVGCKSKSVADISPRVESKEFPVEYKQGDNLSRPPTTSKKGQSLNLDTSKEFYIARQKLKECTDKNNQLTSAIRDLQARLENAKLEGKMLSQKQVKRSQLQNEMFQLIDRQQGQIDAIKKDVYKLEEKMGLKIDEKSREIQESLESCQYHLFQLDHASLNPHLHVLPNDPTGTSTIGQMVIKAIDHLLTFVAAIFVVIATGASSVRHYQVNASRLQHIQVALIIACLFLIGLVLWKFISGPRAAGQVEL